VKLRAVVVGFIAKLPYAGMSFYVLHHVAGLQQLGYEVHYAERLMRPNEAYDPTTGTMSDDAAYGVKYLEAELARLGIGRDRFSFVDRQGRCHGSGWRALEQALDAAEFVLTVAAPTWFDELERCPRRAFVDGDPLFTQLELVHDGSVRSSALVHYDTLFTYAVRVGAADCTVPDAGRTWLPARPVVATDLWEPVPPSRDLPVTALLHWAAGGDVVHEGRTYGHKDSEFIRFLDLPRRVAGRFEAAIGGAAPWKELEAAGWERRDPLLASRTVDDYRRFIGGSRVDFGVAKHAYVASRCGWFSDRSLCFLASGRPVLHQDTGFTDWLPECDGVLPFSDLESAVEALERLDCDYDRHARAARGVAEEHFEAASVLGGMLDRAGLR
jgi:hypothetical protein